MAAENGSEPSPIDKKIIRQVEYYFGDVNLPRDKFLLEKIREEEGWVSMEVMLKFNRLRTLSDDAEVICKAIQKSSSGLMQVNDDCTKIRRDPAKPLPDNTKERKEDINARSVYVKGFPLDVTMDTLMDFFEKHGKIDSIFMRRDIKKDKVFKGSVFVTFADKAEEATFLATDGLKYEEAELKKMTKEDYFKEKQEKNAAMKQGSPEKKKAEEKKAADEEKMVNEQMTQGAVLFVKGLPNNITLEALKAFFSNFGDVGWVEFAMGDEKAFIRFSEGKAQAALDKAKEKGDGKVIFKESELELSVLEGEEEKAYWRRMFHDIAERQKFKRNKQNKFHQNRKRKFGNKSNKQGNRDDGDGESKKPKVEGAEESSN